MPVTEHQTDVAFPAHAELGEGPVWDEARQCLLFVDIFGHQVHTFWPASGAHESFDASRPVGAVVLRDDGSLLLAAHDGFFVAPSDGREVEAFGELTVDGETVRFNDGKVDPRGRFFAGTMDWKAAQPLGSLYMLEGNGRASTALEGVTVSNGLAWTADGKTMYYIDSPRHCVDAFDFDLDTGAMSGRRTVAEVTDGSPDGMAIDDEGCLWVACWGGSRVERLSPADGRRLAVINVPTSQVTSVAFGGPDLDDLYITTARDGLGEGQLAKEPHAGDVFVARPGVSGPAAFRFKTAPGGTV